MVAFSAVQTATGHRSDIAAISATGPRGRGAIVFVDGSQLVGALPVAEELEHVDVLVAPDHKFLLHAGRGLGLLLPLARRCSDRFTPVNAGWRAGRVPLESFFGPEMDLSPTASRFDSSISWIAAIGERGRAHGLRRVRPRRDLRPQPRAHADLRIALGRRLGSGRPARARTGARS